MRYASVGVYGVVIVIMFGVLVVDGRGAQPRGVPETDATSASHPDRTPRAPMVGQGSGEGDAAPLPSPSPEPTQTPVEGGKPSSVAATPQPATSTEVAQSVEQPPVKRQDAGSNPALGATPTPTPTPPVPASNGPSTASNGSSTASDGSSTASDYPSPVPAPTPSTLRAAIEAAFPPSEWERAHRIAMCESGGNPAAIGRLGERGAFQVRPEYHGPVPADLHGQAQQAARIWREQGWRPWSCR